MQRAVAPNPGDRYTSMEELLAALAALQETTATVELPQAVKIRSDNANKACKEEQTLRWLGIATALFLCSLLLFYLTWSQMRPQLAPPKLISVNPSILGVALRFENCSDESYTVAVKTVHGNRRWLKENIATSKGIVQAVVPWKDWIPQGKLEAWGSNSSSFVTTCASLARFKLGKGKVRYHKKAIVVEWPCNHIFKAETNFELDNGKRFQRSAKYRQDKFFVGLSIKHLKFRSMKVWLKLCDSTGHTIETDKVKLQKLDIDTFFEKLKAYKNQTRGIAGLQEKVVTSVLENAELSSVKKLKFGMPNNELVTQLTVEAKNFGKSVENIIAAEVLLLSSPLFHRGLKLRLFNAFTFFQEMDRALYIIGGKPVFRDLGHRRLGNLVRLRRARGSKHPVYKGPGVISVYQGELPLIAVLPGHMRGIREQLVSATINREKADQVSLNFDLSHDWVATCGGKVGLCIRASIEEHSYLRLLLNDKLHLVLWTDRIKSRKTRGILNRELHIPKWILNKGKNTLHLSHVAILPRIERLSVLKMVKLLPAKYLRKRGKRNK